MAEVKVSIIITGASKGLGRGMVVKFSEDGGIVPKVAKGSKMVLMSRDVPELEKTKALVKNPNMEVHLVPFDLSVEEQVIQCTQRAFNILGDPKAYDKNLLVLNADSEIGNWTRAADLQDMSDLTKSFAVNLTSAIYLSSKFCTFFSFEKCLIVNLSSQAAMFPFKNSSLNCSSKAGRQMYINCLKTDHPTVKVLHYTPGAVESENFLKFIKEVDDPEMKFFFDKMYTDKKIVKPLESATKLAKIIREDKYASGDFIDFYEDPEYFAALFAQM